MEDVQGSDKRVYRSVLIGLATGEGALTKPDAKRKLKELLHQIGVNTEAHLVKSTSLTETFRQRAKWWEDNKAVFFKPATRNTMVNHLDKHILSRLGDLPIDEVNERAVQEFISDLHRDGKLAPKSILNVIGVIKLIVGEKVWRDWTLKLPTIPRTEQPYFTPEQMVAIIAKAPERYKVLFSVLAGDLLPEN